MVMLIIADACCSFCLLITWSLIAFVGAVAVGVIAVVAAAVVVAVVAVAVVGHRLID